MPTAPSPESGPPATRREQAKEERRERILAAAEALIRERDDTGFSMRELADSADVAFATPFNLFESKERLLAALLFRRVWPPQRALAASAPGDDAIEHVSDFTTAALHTYTDDEGLFRPLLATVLAPTVRAEGNSLEAAAELWGRCLAPARNDGLLRTDPDDRRLERALHVTFRGALLGWVRGESDLDQVADDLHFTVGTLLAGAVTDDARERVTARFRLGAS
ncbi:MAG: TetR/AcrR family transcriptional regulator [Ilumatobacteraceae bacterium]